MHAIGPRANVFFTHLMTMIFVLVFIGSSFSYIQLKSSSPDVQVRVTELSFLYVPARPPTPLLLSSWLPIPICESLTS